MATAPQPQARSGADGPLLGGRMVGNHVFVQDRVRIEVALEARHRYKYVQPRVLREGLGWKVASPNCSRNVNTAGGEIDIAWLLPAPADGQGSNSGWLLHRRDHARACWVLQLHADSLDAALARLVADPLREYWA